MPSLSIENQSLALDILTDILSAIEKLQDRTKSIRSVDDFLGSSDGMILLDATCMLLIAIGESLKNLDKVTNGELLPTYPSVPWKRVKGLRDIISHHYFDIDADQILWIVVNELSPLKTAIEYFISQFSAEESD
ncbi:MAG: DUF86 domain-containing protein [Prevotella sp.]|nr:DUF86 domain-containing protein [Prevotella sp.]